MGAANTLWLEDGLLCATNTDTYGFMTHLASSAPGWDRRDAPVAVLGAGGAARAIVYGFLEAGVAEVRLFNRTRARAEDLARALWTARQGLRLDGARQRVARCRPCSSTPPRSAWCMPSRSISMWRACAPILWSPTSSTCRSRPLLLPRARARGLRAVDGLGMLLHQAVPGFERWFGVSPRSRPSCVRSSSPTSRGADADHRPHRLHRHGQIHGGRALQQPMALPCCDADAEVHKLYAGRRRSADRGRISRHDGDRPASIAPSWRRRCSPIPPASSALEAIVHPLVRRSRARVSPRRGKRGARQWPCWKFRCCLKPGATNASMS